ncbi:MAG TPA: hypothetical protein VMI53_06115 [Opitutaceae bacterium]|nr:hypothetical protein [Opitutaceae bacterium]
MNRLPVAALLVLAAGPAWAASDGATAVPPAARTDDCHCNDKSPEKLRGFAFKGRVVAVLAGRGEARVAFGDIPGALPAGTHDFKADPAVLAALGPGREILARIEQRNGEWWMFDVRLLIPLPAKP